MNSWTEAQIIEGPLLILEQQLMETLELHWHVQQVQFDRPAERPQKLDHFSTVWPAKFRGLLT